MDFRAFLLSIFWGRGKREFYEKSSLFEKVLTNAKLSHIIIAVGRSNAISRKGTVEEPLHGVLIFYGIAVTSAYGKF